LKRLRRASEVRQNGAAGIFEIADLTGNSIVFAADAYRFPGYFDAS
jgi:hypothetical protein